MIRNINKKKRESFAKEHVGQTKKFFQNILWTDEMNVQALPNGTIQNYCIGPRMQPEDIPYNLQVQSGGFSVMFWGCFSSHGFGPLIAFPARKIDSIAYKELL